MRILLVNQAFYPDSVATSRHLTDIAVYLQGQGHRVSVFCAQRDYNHPQKKYCSKEDFRGVQIRRIAVTPWGKKNIFTRLCDVLLFQVGLIWRLAMDPPPDVVACLTTPPLLGFVISLYGRIRKVPCVQYIMDLHPHTAVEMGYLRKESWVTRLLYSFFSFSVRNSDRVVVLDRWMGNKVREHGVEESRIRVVPLWPTVLKKTAAVDRRQNKFRLAYNIGDKFVLLYSGNHGVAHPLDTILEAAIHLKNDPNFLFLFVGSGERVKDVKEAVEKHQLKNVLQLPFQPEELLQECLTAADVHLVVMGDRVAGLVHPSKIYGVLAVGKPYIFVGPKQSPVGDLLDECLGGWHISHGEVDKLVATLKEIRCWSVETLSQWGKRNADYASRHFLPEEILLRFANALTGPFTH